MFYYSIFSHEIAALFVVVCKQVYDSYKKKRELEDKVETLQSLLSQKTNGVVMVPYSPLTGQGGKCQLPTEGQSALQPEAVDAEYEEVVDVPKAAASPKVDASSATEACVTLPSFIAIEIIESEDLTEQLFQVLLTKVQPQVKAHQYTWCHVKRLLEEKKVFVDRPSVNGYAKFLKNTLLCDHSIDAIRKHCKDGYSNVSYKDDKSLSDAEKNKYRCAARDLEEFIAKFRSVKESCTDEDSR